MVIERTSDEIIIRLPSYINTDDLQGLIDYLIYKESVSKSEATQADVDALASDVKSGWWEKNKDRLIK